MRKLIFAINTTLDGCVDHTKQFVDEEKLEYFTHLTREVDLQVFGRKTYQLMVPYWPEVLKNQSETKADHEFARAFDSTNKLVFHDRWTALKIKIRELFVRIFATKYLN
jgi:dihydrofolate reductase